MKLAVVVVGGGSSSSGSASGCWWWVRRGGMPMCTWELDVRELNFLGGGAVTCVTEGKVWGRVAIGGG